MHAKFRAAFRHDLEEIDMQTNQGQQGQQGQQQQEAKQPLNTGNDSALPPEQESTGRGTGTGNATGFTDPAHVDVEKNRDARRKDPNDLGDAGDYSR